MNMYYTYLDVYRNGNLLDSGPVGSIMCEDTKTEIRFDLTWDNLEEKYQEDALMFPFNIWNYKKGRMISFFHGALFNKEMRDIKEWKQDLGITVIQRYKLVEEPTFEQLKIFPVEKIQKYLKERN